ncbi:MAG: NusG domain II-containing protein [Thermotogae bacterium]|nr:NusG domain II-containing protein [Thermotogota bacterium]
MKTVRKNDFYIIIFIIILALSVLIINKIISSHGITGYEIYYDGRKVAEITKEGRTDIKDPDGEHMLYVEFYEGKVRVTESTCPDKVCEHMGWVEDTGRDIICVPNKVIIKPLGKSKSDIDIFSQ